MDASGSVPLPAVSLDRPFVSVGETMVSFVSRDGAHEYRAIAAGAESNAATGVVRLGGAARWVSRVGRDPLGDVVEELVAGTGVETDVVRDAARPTGIMTKHVRRGSTTTGYHRAGSAASALGPADLPRLTGAGWIHLTGITPALSTSAADLVAAVLEHHDTRVSFDLNYRAALWPDSSHAAASLTPLARLADVILVGDDEAELVFGTADVHDLAGLLLRRDGQELIMKRGAVGAEVVVGGEREATDVVQVSGLGANAVDPTGAGDAFAAGYLTARRLGWALDDSLRLGHVMGARVVEVLDDVPPPFEGSECAALSPEALRARWPHR